MNLWVVHAHTVRCSNSNTRVRVREYTAKIISAGVPTKKYTWPYCASVFWYGGKVLQSNAAVEIRTNREFGHPTHCILLTAFCIRWSKPVAAFWLQIWEFLHTMLPDQDPINVHETCSSLTCLLHLVLQPVPRSPVFFILFFNLCLAHLSSSSCSSTCASLTCLLHLVLQPVLRSPVFFILFFNLCLAHLSSSSCYSTCASLTCLLHLVLQPVPRSPVFFILFFNLCLAHLSSSSCSSTCSSLTCLLYLVLQPVPRSPVFFILFFLPRFVFLKKMHTNSSFKNRNLWELHNCDASASLFHVPVFYSRFFLCYPFNFVPSCTQQKKRNGSLSYQLTYLWLRSREI